MDNLPNEHRLALNDAYEANRNNIDRPPTREELENQYNIDLPLIRRANRRLNEDRQQLAVQGDNLRNLHAGKISRRRQSRRRQSRRRQSRRRQSRRI